uniref:Protein-tyrosine-phosphatase n=1 Tax=Strongyloides stercoralis TaxID=6248 RepID=A0A0K0EBW0_STRER
MFIRNEKVIKSNLYFHGNNEVITWLQMAYNMSGDSTIYCGELLLVKGNTNIYNVHYWYFNLKWEKKPDVMETALPYNVTTKLPDVKDKCGPNQNETLIFLKDKKNGLRQIGMNDTILGYANDLYYFFRIPDTDDKIEINDACLIVKAVSKQPEIIMVGHKPILVSSNNLDFHVIKQDHVAGLYSIRLDLKNETEIPNFYEREAVKMTRMKFRRTGIEEIPNSSKIITSTFVLKGFQTLKFSYNWSSFDGTKKIEKIFYLGPESENHKFPNQQTVYFQNDPAIQPNCSTNRINFGYLEAVTVDDETVKLNDLKDGGEVKNNFKRVKDFVFMSDVEKNNVTLLCSYITPNGKVILEQTFLKGVKVFLGYDDNKKEVYEVKLKNDKSDKLEKELAEKEKQLALANKSSFEKLKNNVGTFGAYSIIIVPILILLITIIIIGILCYLKIFKPLIEKKKIQNKHSNIFSFWSQISRQNLERYSEAIQRDKYIPDKVKNQNVSKKIEGGEEVVVDPYACFDDSLVKCYKNINGEVKAHYISDVSPVRTYIISDEPSPDKEEYFWELLYCEDVEAVVAIIYQQDDITRSVIKKLFYCPENKEQYGKVTVEFEENIQSNTPFVEAKRFSITIGNEKSKKVIIFHANNWKEHEIPRSDLHLIKLYKKVSEYSGTGKVLVHTSFGSASRAFIYTYFSCIFEAMKEDNTIDNPLEIIKKVREQRYGGNISSMEFAYIIKALVTYFFESKVLFDITNHKPIFSEQYDNYMLKFDVHEFNMDPSIKNFLKFVNFIDDGKLKNICDQSVNLQVGKNEDIKLKCKRFYAVVERSKNLKVRYSNIPCLDKTSINIGGKGLNDIDGFIHANEFVYRYGGGKERKIIMFQGPSQQTMDDTLDMIYRYKIGIVVALVNNNEMGKEDKCFGYLLTGMAPVSFGNYSLMYKRHRSDQNRFFIEYDYSVADNASEIIHNFKILHYINWPDSGIPVERQSLLGLYNRIIELYDNQHIAIHCSAGIGRTGTLALIIYMIDVINSQKFFDPIKCLVKIRQHRCKAVQTVSQFVFALSILYERFKEQIDTMDKGAYKYFMNLAENIYNQNTKM